MNRYVSKQQKYQTSHHNGKFNQSQQYLVHTVPFYKTEHTYHRKEAVKYCSQRRTETTKVEAIAAEAEAEL